MFKGGTYVIGDIHGNYTEWTRFKRMIEQEDSDPTFILIGDIIDRGPETLKMIDWAMENITKTGKFQMIMGNHEFAKIYYWDNYYETAMDECDTDEVDTNYLYCDSYDFAETYQAAHKTWTDMEKFVRWAEKLEYYKDIVVNNQRFIIAHADIPDTMVNKVTNTLRPPKNLNEKDFVTFNRNYTTFTAIKDAILIQGHNASVFEDSFPDDQLVDVEERLGKIVYMKTRINIDCGLTYRQYGRPGNLAAIRLDDMKEFYLYK